MMIYVCKIQQLCNATVAADLLFAEAVGMATHTQIRYHLSSSYYLVGVLYSRYNLHDSCTAGLVFFWALH